MPGLEWRKELLKSSWCGLTIPPYCDAETEAVGRRPPLIDLQRMVSVPWSRKTRCQRLLSWRRPGGRAGRRGVIRRRGKSTSFSFYGYGTDGMSSVLPSSPGRGRAVHQNRFRDRGYRLPGLCWGLGAGFPGLLVVGPVILLLLKLEIFDLEGLPDLS